MEHFIKISIIILFLTISSGLSYSHQGHINNKINDFKSIGYNKITTITESNRINYSIENGNCFLEAASQCDCCCGNICFGFDYKCGPYENNSKKNSCMNQCSQNESNSTPPINSSPTQKIKVNLDLNNTDLTNSEIKTFKVLSTENSFKVSTPTYITVRALLI